MARGPEIDWDRLDCRAVAEALGVRIAEHADRRADNWLAHCPNGNGHANGDRNPSCSIGRSGFQCFGCGEKGGALALVELATGRPRAESVAWIARYQHGEAERMPTRERPADAPEKREAPDVAPAEVLAWWARMVPLERDPDAVAWIASRGLSAAAVADDDLARALPVGVLDAYHRRGFRVVLPCYSATGEIVSLRFRRIEAGEGPKEIVLKGTHAKGAVLASPEARRLLRDATAEARAPIVIAEGVPDFLTFATAYGDACEARPAMFGIWSGAWSIDHARRLPIGATVIVATHADDAGDRYDDAILTTLAEADRGLRYVRAELDTLPTGFDINDARREGIPAAHWLEGYHGG